MQIDGYEGSPMRQSLFTLAACRGGWGGGADLHVFSPECRVPDRSMCDSQSPPEAGHEVARVFGRGRSGFVTTSLPEYTCGGGGKAAS